MISSLKYVSWYIRVIILIKYPIIITGCCGWIGGKRPLADVNGHEIAWIG